MLKLTDIFGATTISKTTFCITTLSINDIQHGNTMYQGGYSDCLVLFIVMLIVIMIITIMLIVIMLIVIMLIVIMLIVIMLIVIMLIFIRLDVIILNVLMLLVARPKIVTIESIL